MNESIMWDVIPMKRTKKEEKYNFPVLTMSALSGDKGVGRKFTFNKAAQIALGLEAECKVNFGYDTASKEHFVRKASGEGKSLTKTFTMSDKKTYNFLVESLGLDSSVENDLALIETSRIGVFQITAIGQVMEIEEKGNVEYGVSDEKEEIPFILDTEETIEEEVSISVETNTLNEEGLTPVADVISDEDADDTDTEEQW
jgi:hypothetical protein